MTMRMTDEDTQITLIVMSRNWWTLGKSVIISETFVNLFYRNDQWINNHHSYAHQIYLIIYINVYQTPKIASSREPTPAQL